MLSVLPDTHKQHPESRTVPTQQRQAVPHELKAHPQWVAWRYGKPRPNGGAEKVPISPVMGKRAATNDPTTWGTFEEAIAAADRYGLEGIGFVFTTDDPYCGVDFDSCLDPETGELHPYVARIIARLGGYAEISPSETGVKVIVRASKPGDQCRAFGPWGGEIEMYDSRRFFTFTGRALSPKMPIGAAQTAVNALYRRALAEEENKATTEHTGATLSVSVADEVLLDKARANPKFRQLYDAGDASGYPSQSEADLALCGYAAFWTGKDRERMDRWYRQSALYREKWEREDYREGTLDKAIAGCTKAYDPTGRPRTNGEARQMLAGWVTLKDALPWSGRGAAIDRAAFKKIIETGLEYGRVGVGGVLVYLSSRDVADHANCGDGSARRALRDLETKYGYIKRVSKGVGRRAAQYLIKPSPEGAREAAHIVPPYPVSDMGRFARLIREIRNAPPFERRVQRSAGSRTVSSTVQTNRALIQPITKSEAKCLDRVVKHGKITLTELAELEGVKRKRDLARRDMAHLVEAGLVREECPLEVQDTVYTAPDDIMERLEEHIVASGCRQNAERQRQRHERERAEYEHRLLHQSEPEEVPEPVERPMEVEQFTEPSR